MLRRVHDQRPPAAADIEEAFARLEAELAADQIELGLLRLIERVIRLGEVGAGVDHAPIEPETIESVTDIVVIADHLLIAPACVGAALFPGAMCCGLPIVRARAQAIDQERGSPQQVAQVRAIVADRLGQLENVLQIAIDIPVAAQERLAKGELVRVQQGQAQDFRCLQDEGPIGDPVNRR